MTQEQFIQQLLETNEEFKQWYNHELPDIVGVEAVNFFKESFQKEGFADEALIKWEEVKRRIDPQRPDHAAASRKILTGETGDLGRSIEYDGQPGEVKIVADTTGAGSDKDYAAAHNEGTTTAGKGHNITIPQRKFIGESKTLDEKLKKEMEDGARRILGK